MQASNAILNKYYCNSTDEAGRVSTPTPRLAIIACLFLMATAVPEAGLVPSTEILPFDNSFSDLSLSEATDHFEKRLSRNEKNPPRARALRPAPVLTYLHPFRD